MIFLGHVILGEGIIVDPKKVKVVLKWERPTNMIEIYSFLNWQVYWGVFYNSDPSNPINPKWSEMRVVKGVWRELLGVKNKAYHYPSVNTSFRIQMVYCL